MEQERNPPLFSKPWRVIIHIYQRSLHVFITKLRHKLAEDDNVRIINIRGIGYKMIMPMPRI